MHSRNVPGILTNETSHGIKTLLNTREMVGIQNENP